MSNVDWYQLATTLIAGVIAIICAIGIIIITLSGVRSGVPDELTSTLLLTTGVAIGGASRISRP